MTVPFLIWPGGKRALLDELLSRVPPDVRTYREVCVGGGALFFALAPQSAVLSDANPELVNCYTVVRDNHEQLKRVLRGMRVSERDYYDVRDKWQLGRRGPVALAARTIYLNRLGYNGLYRVSSSGKFNVPYSGRKFLPSVVFDLIDGAHAALRGVTLRACTAIESLREAGKGDFIYVDPPYASRPGRKTFVEYTPHGFTDADQAELATACRVAVKRRARVMVSNADVPLVRALFDGWRIDEVTAPRTINRDPNGRGPVPELIIRSW